MKAQEAAERVIDQHEEVYRQHAGIFDFLKDARTCAEAVKVLTAENKALQNRLDYLLEDTDIDLAPPASRISPIKLLTCFFEAEFENREGRDESD